MADNTGGIGTPKSTMTCIRINHINDGSRTPPALPTPIVKNVHMLTAGDIAGIVIGVVVAASLLAGFAFWFWRRQKRNRLPIAPTRRLVQQTTQLLRHVWKKAVKTDSASFRRLQEHWGQRQLHPS